MDQSDPNQSSNVQSNSPDAAQTQTPPVQQPSSDASPAPAVEQPTQQSHQSPAPEANNNAQDNYVTNVGGSLVSLLTDISLSDQRKQKLADTMRLPASQVTTLLDGLLDKIDSEQLTEAELALIMTSPVTDEAVEQKQPA